MMAWGRWGVGAGAGVAEMVVGPPVGRVGSVPVPKIYSGALPAL